MKILFISEQFPYPLDSGGNIRTFNILKALAAEHRVTLLATAQAAPADAHIDAVRMLGVEIRLVRVPQRGVFHQLRSLLLALTGPMPFSMARHLHKSVRQAVREAFRNHEVRQAEGAAPDRRFDAVHFNHLDAAIYASEIPEGVLRVLDEHNVVTNQMLTTCKHELRTPRKCVMTWDIPRLRRYEAATCNAMDMTIACSATDAHALRMLGVRGCVKVIPNGVDLAYFQRLPRVAARSTDVVFVGTMDYDPCERAVHYFCLEILPLIRRAVPSARFIVVGRNPSQRLKAIADLDRGVILTGRVGDVRPFVQPCAVFVVPLLSGSGTRLKILEAMAMGIPIVTTTIGVEGIGAVDGDHLLIADSPSDFARAVLNLFDDRERADALVNSARKLVQHEYGWVSISRQLREAYRAPTERPTQQESTLAIAAT